MDCDAIILTCQTKPIVAGRFWWRAIAAQWDLSIDTVKDTAVKLASSEEIRDFG